jgi:hypothetical protein
MGAPADFPLYLQPFSKASSSTLRQPASKLRGALAADEGS